MTLHMASVLNEVVYCFDKQVQLVMSFITSARRGGLELEDRRY